MLSLTAAVALGHTHVKYEEPKGCSLNLTLTVRLMALSEAAPPSEPTDGRCGRPAPPSRLASLSLLRRCWSQVMGVGGSWGSRKWALEWLH